MSLEFIQIWAGYNNEFGLPSVGALRTFFLETEEKFEEAFVIYSAVAL